MASAQTEPSMDEILASIRRIISEEDDAPQEVPVRQKLETLTLRDDQPADESAAADEPVEKPKPRARARKAQDDDAAAETAQASEDGASSDDAEATEQDAGEPEAEGGSDHVAEAPAQSEMQSDEADDLDDFEPLPEEPVPASSTMEPAAEAHDHGEVTDDTFGTAPASVAEVPAPAVDAVSDAVRPAALAAATEALAVSEQASGQARSAFGALEENMRLSSGSGRTIEDLIETMLAPMLKSWLDENLPRIVEDKVEEEVRRISRRR